VLKWFIILALPLTLGSKLIVRPDIRRGPNETEGQQKVAEFLVRHNFTVASSNRANEGVPIIRAGAGMCRILLATTSPIASDRDVIRRYATVTDRVFVVFRGRTYEEQPTWLTVPYFLLARLQRELGLWVQATPLLTVIATPSCDAERLPWSELG
jgi:hypothetical protein